MGAMDSKQNNYPKEDIKHMQRPFPRFLKLDRPILGDWSLRITHHRKIRLAVHPFRRDDFRLPGLASSLHLNRFFC